MNIRNLLLVGVSTIIKKARDWDAVDIKTLQEDDVDDEKTEQETLIFVSYIYRMYMQLYYPFLECKYTILAFVCVLSLATAIALHYWVGVVGWMDGWMEKVEIKPTQPNLAGAWLSFAKTY